jgi:hypothetical protein
LPILLVGIANSAKYVRSLKESKLISGKARSHLGVVSCNAVSAFSHGSALCIKNLDGEVGSGPIHQALALKKFDDKYYIYRMLLHHLDLTKISVAKLFE